MRNILANFIGSACNIVIFFACVPFYVKLLGIEAYGLIGFFIMLQSLLQIFDFGLSMTMNRGIARYAVIPEKKQESRDFARTLEIISYAVGAVIGITLFIAAPYLSGHWLKAEGISAAVLSRTVMAMAILIILQWPFNIYQGGLMGLQRQVALNALNIFMVALAQGGGILFLRLVDSTITAYFIWQIAASALRLLAVTTFFWRYMPDSGGRPKFNLNLIKKVRYFAIGMGGITFFSLFFAQIDKVFLSKLLTLKIFGYYTLASMLAAVPTFLAVAIFNAALPRFSGLEANGDLETLKQFYHRSCQFIAALVLPVMAVIIFFSFEIVLLWTGNIETARNVAPIASILVVGSAINALMSMPYGLQLAYGWTKLTLVVNALIAVVIIPGIFFMTNRYGALGAASIWVILNAVYMLATIPIMHRRLIKMEMWHWIFGDVAVPLATAVVASGVLRWLILIPKSQFRAFAILFLILLGTITVTALVLPQLRSMAMRKFSKKQHTAAS